MRNARVAIRERDDQIPVHGQDQLDAEVVVVALHLVHVEQQHVLLPAPAQGAAVRAELEEPRLLLPVLDLAAVAAREHAL